MTTSTAFPQMLTDQTFTFYVDGKNVQILRDHPQWDEVIRLAQLGDKTAVDLAKPAVKVQAAFTAFQDENVGCARRAPGNLEVTEFGVTLNGQALHGYVIDCLMRFMRMGLDITPWVNFVRKLHQNPSAVARNELYLWLEKAEMPIAPDGDFIAYKRVRHDYRDVHSGKFDNSVGQVVSMNRLDVDDDRNKTCSAGLHFCSKDYLPQFSGERVVVLKINPADVVSIPNDYDNTKGRTWRYEVVGEITLEEAGLKSWDSPLTSDYGDYEEDDDYVDDIYDDEDEYDDGYIDFDDDEEDDDDGTSNPVVGWLKKVLPFS